MGEGFVQVVRTRCAIHSSPCIRRLAGQKARRPCAGWRYTGRPIAPALSLLAQPSKRRIELGQRRRYQSAQHMEDDKGHTHHEQDEKGRVRCHCRTHIGEIELGGHNDAHRARDVTDVRPLLGVAGDVYLTFGRAVALHALGVVHHGAHIAKHGAARLAAKPIDLLLGHFGWPRSRIGIEPLEGSTLVIIGCVIEVARVEVREPDGVIRPSTEERRNRLSGNGAVQPLEVVFALRGMVDGVLVDRDEVPDRVHLAHKHARLLEHL